MTNSKALVTSVLLLSFLRPQVVNAGLGKAVVRGASRGLARKAATKSISKAATKKALTNGSRQSAAKTLSLDRLRDAKSAVIRLPQPRKVYRYTSAKQAEWYRHRGISSGTHFTAKAGPGRPLSAINAKKRLGLPRLPSRRIEAEIPKGTAVKANKVLGGRPGGYGELKTYRRKLPSTAVKKVRPLQ